MKDPIKPQQTMNRRQAMQHSAGMATGVSILHNSATKDFRADLSPEKIRTYLKKLLMQREDVEGWLASTLFPFGKYDAQLGYLHIDRDFKEGLDAAVCHYRYDKLNARRAMAHAAQPCRINTYGNSFTSCEQVSDGETWQEVLASHLGEPIHNYGVGGYSVYQSYLRMRREEERAPAKYIIFNIFDDDHERNLHGWQRFKFGVNRISANPTVPHVQVDPDHNRFCEHPNPCPTPESLLQLADLDDAYTLFKNDFVLHNRLQRQAKRQKGLPTPPTDYDDSDLMRHGIYATTRIIERIEQFAASTDRKILYVLSYGGYTLRQFISENKRFDQLLIDFLKHRQLPYVDMMTAHAEDYAKFQLEIAPYLSRYFVGHYNPLGNFFCAFAIKNAIVQMTSPKPPAYLPPRR